MSTKADPTVQKLLSEALDASKAWMNGDGKPYTELMAHTPEFTIFGPFGGTPPAGWTDNSARMQAATAAQFQGGTSTIELVQAYVAHDIIVLAMIERSTVKFRGQESTRRWDLRTTQVYRREGTQWKIVHRHAEPLIAPRNLEQTLQLLPP